jgi:hypothetical protein
MKLKGRCFETVSDIKRESQAVLDSIKGNYLNRALEALKKGSDCCIYSQRDYFEKDGSQIKLSQHYFSDLVQELSDSTSYILTEQREMFGYVPFMY